jgi:CRISPR-associated protein Csb1
MPHPLALSDLQSAVAGTAAAFRCTTELQPAGGTGDKVFPATYEGGKYAVEQRRLVGASEPVDCVLLDSVQSQANRMEMALLDAWERGRIGLPVISVDFKDKGLPKTLKITSLEAPHRIADALLRDSLHDDKPFRKSEIGSQLDHVDNRNATALFRLCPTALVFGMWDSTGPKGGLGAKFARVMVSEIIGVAAVRGVKTSSRIDPAQISSNAGPLYERDASDGGFDWTLDEDEAVKEKKAPVLYNRSKNAQGKPGNPSKANHSNVTPTIADGGFTIANALQTTVLSLPGLRRLRFPLNGKTEPTVDIAARVALAALALCAAALAREQGCDLRSRCQLVPTQPNIWELLDQPGQTPQQFVLSASAAIDLLKAAVAQVKSAKLPWLEEELKLDPSPQLVALVKKSQELAANLVVEEV